MILNTNDLIRPIVDQLSTTDDAISTVLAVEKNAAPLNASDLEIVLTNGTRIHCKDAGACNKCKSDGPERKLH